MKTITHYKAQMIAQDLGFYIPTGSPLGEFGKTGLVFTDQAVIYHSHLDELLGSEYKFLKKELEDLQKLKNYFREHAPLPIGVVRDPANIKHVEYDNILHRGERTEFQITWDELIIIPVDKMKMFSISLEDAKKLAKIILNK